MWGRNFAFYSEHLRACPILATNYACEYLDIDGMYLCVVPIYGTLAGPPIWATFNSLSLLQDLYDIISK